jgi:uncharacterized protein (TIGR02147 family)
MNYMFNQHYDYRQLLRDTLIERCNSNPRYSLRAFARDLKLSPARLSEILHGKKGLSRGAAAEVAGRLGLQSAETERFCNLVDSAHARSPVARKLAKERLTAELQNSTALNLQMDTFRIVSDWYHFAITQLMQLKDFKSDENWIAQRLGIDSLTVKAALERMERLQMIEKVRGRYRPVNDFIHSPDGVPSEALRKFQKQFLEKAIQALSVQSVDERDFTTLVMPIDTDKIPLAKKRIRKFRQDLCDELSEGKNLDQVYALSVQFYRLSQ